MKKISLLILMALGACQASGPSIVVYDAPASDAADSLDFSKLPEGFPIIAEMGITPAPKRCGLSKAKRGAAAEGDDYDSRYVFASQENDSADGPLYNVGIRGQVRTFKPSQAADMGDKKVRYFKTIDAPEVEIQVVLEPEGASENSIIGRIKAWDAGLPLLCAYNRIEVTGDCDL